MELTPIETGSTPPPYLARIPSMISDHNMGRLIKISEPLGIDPLLTADTLLDYALTQMEKESITVQFANPKRNGGQV